MLTNKNRNSSLYLKNLKNKSFYLDTNIIYRALGINGEDRQKRSQTFLKKFNDSEENIIISISTENEFKASIKKHAKNIEIYNSPRIDQKLFQEFNIKPDIYNFYHKWRIGKVNDNIKLFIADIDTAYDDFKKKFKVHVDTQKPFNNNDKTVKDILMDYTSSISSFKFNEGNKIITNPEIDAENILWIEKKRNNQNQNIFDTKFFFYFNRSKFTSLGLSTKR